MRRAARQPLPVLLTEVKDEELEVWRMREEIMRGVYGAVVNWKEDEDVLLLQRGIEPAFFDAFSAGVAAYLKGDWGPARDHITEALKYEPNDGPSETLMKQLTFHNFSAPEGWEGYRALTQKY